jgi:tagatose-1,6-bisphosphate aldolase non-catalytic subunit AgaZ/GatZ
MAIPKLNFTVTKEQTAAFAKAWDSGGIKIILDNTSIQFACDWANLVLKSFVADMAAQVAKVAEAKLAAQKAQQPSQTPTDVVAATPVPPAAPQKSLITLTDM